MKIKYVDYPLENYPDIEASYSTVTKTCLVKRNLPIKTQKFFIKHEYGHYLIDKSFSIPFIKHYLNLIYEIIWVLLFYKKSDKLFSIRWAIQYYKKARKHGRYVY